MITKRKGHGQTICKGCKEKGEFGLNWDSFLYNFNDEPYCFDCLMERLEEYQQRIDEAIEYVEHCRCGEYLDGGNAYDLLEILKGSE